jgi:hypothetical protein
MAVMALALALLCAGAQATLITGTVHNGTTNTPAAGVDVLLMALSNDMNTVASTKTDSQGHYQIKYDVTGQMPMLVRAVYKGVNFHGMLPPGQDSVDIQVFEPDSDAKIVQFPARLVAFQPQGSSLLIGEEYEVQNQSQPPKAFFNAQGDFQFHIPDGAELSNVSAQGPENMPVTQGTIDRGKNLYAIAFAFRPGTSLVRISYELSYQGNQAKVQLPSDFASERIMLLAPPSVELAAPGFQPAGTEQGMAVYTRDHVPAGSPIDVSISGTAPPTSDSQDNSGQQAANGRVDSGPPVVAVPPRLDSLKWVLLAGFGAMFLLGALYLWRRPAMAASASAAPPSAVLNGDAPTPSAAGTRSLAGNRPEPAAAALRVVEKEVGTSLDQLKDTLFRLELRHQAGTISEQEYAEQRARAEKILRDLVRG